MKFRMQIVKRIAGPSKIRLTVAPNGHLDVSDLRKAMKTLGKRPAFSPTRSRPRSSPARNCSRGVQLGSKRSPRAKKEGPGPLRFLRRAGPLQLERNTGFEPATFALARRTDRVHNRSRWAPTVPN